MSFLPFWKVCGSHCPIKFPRELEDPRSPMRWAATCRLVPYSVTAHGTRPRCLPPHREARGCRVWGLLMCSPSCSWLMSLYFPCLPTGRQRLPPGSCPGGSSEAPCLHGQAFFSENPAHPAASQVTGEDPAPSPAVPQYPDTR